MKPGFDSKSLPLFSIYDLLVRIFCLIISLLTIQLVVAQIGTKSQVSKPTGVWVNNQFGYQMTLMLNEDGTGEFDGEAIRYTVSGNRLSVIQSGLNTTYLFNVSGNTLTLSGGDIDGSISFNRLSPPGNVPPGNNPAGQGAAGKSSVVGVWSGHGETIEFSADGQCTYRGETFPYRLSGSNIILQTPMGDAVMGYQVSGNTISLSANGQTLTYSKSSGTAPASGGGQKHVARELVGKWCYVNVHTTNTGGSSTEKCITLNADGTYEYYGETSRSVNTDAYYGGTNSQSSDRGTWSYDGARLYYTSQSGQSGSFRLEKRNHPKNNDPMIVLDGETYVTYYQKAPW